MRLDDIKGKVTKGGFYQWIELTSFRWGLGRSITDPTSGPGTRLGSEQPEVSEIVVTKLLGSSSANLFNSLFGKPSPATIAFTKQDAGMERTYLRIDLQDVLISGYSVSGGGAQPSESLSLNFTDIKYQFTN